MNMVFYCHHVNIYFKNNKSWLMGESVGRLGGWYCAMKKSIFPTRKYKTIGFPRVTPLLSHEYFNSNTHRTTLLSLVSPLYKSAVPTEVV